MTATIACLLCLTGYALAYRFYSKHIATRVFQLRDDAPTPAHTQRDDYDYIPTHRYVLFGHHYASITGLAPMLGPAVAVIWGWLPAMIWVVCGAVFIGCVHDFSALVVSMRARGMSIGKVAEGIIGPRATMLFHAIIFFGISLAMGVFVFVIATLFGTSFYPQAVLPSGGLMVVAMIMGFLIYKKGWRVAPLTAGAFVLMLLMVWGGMELPTLGLSAESWPSTQSWIWILLGYAFAASVLPVWSLLQSRDFINSLLLYLGLGAMYLGFFVIRPEFKSPAFNPSPEGAPSIFPFVFIVIACGAASGFHGLVSSGTTAKQIDREPDARFVGYGGMVGESLLGLIAVLACTAGFSDSALWHEHYASWSSTQGLGNKISAFVNGSAMFCTGLGIPEALARSFIATVVVSFALTTLDSATRLLRFNISEIGEWTGAKPLGNPFLASIAAVLAIAFFAFFKIAGKPAGLALWELFGATNQLLAALTLLVVTLYLIQRRMRYAYTLVPMIFMMVSTMVAMSSKLGDFWNQATGPDAKAGAMVLFVVGGILMLLGVALVVESFLALRRALSAQAIESLDIELKGPA